MSTTAGALSKVSVGKNAASLLSAGASGGTGPYTYQWYRSTTTGFTPGAGNLISGATALTLDDTGLDAGTTYFYKVKATDSGAVADTSGQLTVTTAAALPEQNQFAQSQVLGQVVLGNPVGTYSAQIGEDVTDTLVAGQAVKVIDDANGLPQVEPCDADDDELWGFINYDVKSQGFVAGDRCEISQAGNVMLLQATGPVARGEEVCLDVTYVGGVRAKSDATNGDTIAGYAYDKASAAQLIRVKLGNRFLVK